MRKTTAIAMALMLAAVLAATTGCTRVRLRDDPATRTETENRVVPLEGAGKLEAEITMGVGEMTLGSQDSSGTAMSADFVYAPATWKPEVSYAVFAGTGRLVIRQPDSAGLNPIGNVRNTWTVRLGNGVPTDLRLRLGVGTSDVDLRGLDLGVLDVMTGVGKTTIDLSGPRTRGMNATIEAGVGELTLRLPRSVGARVTGGEDGLGEFLADGVRVRSGSWINDAYSGSGPKIDIVLRRGVGDVTILLVD